MKYPADVIEEWIDRINNEATKPLSKWEKDFMESITDQFDRRRFLTDPQIEKLETIYANKTD